MLQAVQEAVSMMKKFLAIISGLASLPAAAAHCPLCTAATGAAVGVARVYGVDDAIMGVLVGGFLVSSALWFNNWLKKKQWFFFPGQSGVIVLLTLVLTIVGFKTGGLLSGVLLWGFSRLLVGLLFGSVLAVIGHWVHEYLRAINSGRNFVAYQGMSLLILSILLGSLVFAGGLA